jgi:hypothetical protein
MAIKVRETSEAEIEVARVRERTTLPRLLRRFWTWSATTFGMTLVLAWVEFRAGFSTGRWDPLLAPFIDLKEYPGTYRLLHTAAFFFNVPGNPLPYPLFSPVAYPPFAAVVMAPMYAASSPAAVYLAVAAIALGVAVWAVRRALMREGIGGVTATLFPLTLVLMSFPIVRLVNQGNIELVLWIFAAAGCLAYVREKDDLAAVLWGLAAAMKLYPIVLLILLVPRRRYRAIAVGLATFVGTTVLSLAWLGPTIEVAWRGSLRNVFGYQGLRAGEWSLRELVANHSAFEVVKVVATIGGVSPAKLTLPYYACGAAVLGLAFFGRLWKMPVANQLLAVSVFMVLLPPISYYHALVHLYAPLLMLMFLAIRAERAGVRVQGLELTVMLFVPLFASFTLFTFPSFFLFDGLVQAFLLFVLFCRAVRFPFRLESGYPPTPPVLKS